MNREYREIVFVVDGYHLVDAESYQRTYSAIEGRSLRPGYYIASWPSGTANPHFLHDGLRFTGPFAKRADAQSRLDSDSVRDTAPVANAA